MKIEGNGPIRLVTDNAGTIRGLWVERLEHAQFDNDFHHPRLRMFLACEAAQGRSVPVEAYAAVAQGQFRVQENAPSSGGGYLLIFT